MTVKRCSDADRRGRLAKARDFLQAAALVDDLADDGDLIDAAVTLYVHAGIAAADALCCRHLGQHAQGQDHREAVALLQRVDRDRSRELSVLLSLKTRAGYSPDPTSAQDAKKAKRAASKLVDAASAS